MSKKVTILLPLLQDIGHVHVKSDVLLLCSGSADCFLWKSAERPLRCHTGCVTGAQSSGECFYAAFVYQKPPLWVQTDFLCMQTSFTFSSFPHLMSAANTCIFPSIVSQTKCATLPPGSAVAMLRALFQDVHVQVGAGFLSFKKNLMTEGGVLIHRKFEWLIFFLTVLFCLMHVRVRCG